MQTYDSSGNFVKTQTDELNNTSSFNYDANGNLQDSTDPSGKKVSFLYTLPNKIKSVTLNAASPIDDITVSYQYDAQGNLQYRTDPRGNVTSFDYNAINKTKTNPFSLG